MLDRERQGLLRKLFEIRKNVGLDKDLQNEWDRVLRMVERNLPFTREAFVSLVKKVEAK